VVAVGAVFDRTSYPAYLLPWQLLFSSVCRLCDCGKRNEIMLPMAKAAAENNFHLVHFPASKHVPVAFPTAAKIRNI